LEFFSFSWFYSLEFFQNQFLKSLICFGDAPTHFKLFL
jgi:hypothetical protein